MTFTEHDHARLATLFDGVRMDPADPFTGVPRVPYPGYKPEVREAPNGDMKPGPHRHVPESPFFCDDCHVQTHELDGTPRAGSGCLANRVPNVDAGPAGKRYLHVAPKYNPPAWAVEYLARAHYEACRVAEALGVPAAYYPHVADGTLRVLEYPSARHDWRWLYGKAKCAACAAPYSIADDGAVCPVLAPGAGTAEHKDFDLFTIVLWRSTPEDLELTARRQCAWEAYRINPGLHIGELGELVGLGPATPHRVPARPYVQKSVVYFAIPAHEAELPKPVTFPATDTRPQVTVHTVGQWLKERTARSWY